MRASKVRLEGGVKLGPQHGSFGVQSHDSWKVFILGGETTLPASETGTLSRRTVLVAGKGQPITFVLT